MLAATASDVKPRVQFALANSPIHELRRLQVDEHEGTLILSGAVSSFYHKQLAQEAVRSLCQGVAVINAICVEIAADSPLAPIAAVPRNGIRNVMNREVPRHTK